MTEEKAMSDTPAVKLTPIRAHILQEVDDAGQSFRIARRLGMATTSISSGLQFLSRAGLAHWRGSRWQTTDKGRALLDALKEEGEGR